MEIHSKDFTMTPCTVRYCNHGYTNSKRSTRKTMQPRKTPVRCGKTSSSVVVKFELVSGTPTPCLQIKTSGSHPYTFKARRRLFSQIDNNWGEDRTECETIALPTTDKSSTPESEGETEVQDTNTPNGDSKYKPICKAKVCASCKTKKTPLWRDAEDGTPYCNACGIRFKKYRVCCPMCSYIPRKDEKFGNICCQCGSTLYYNKT